MLKKFSEVKYIIPIPNIQRQWTLDVRKMSRPERSGVLANLIVYSILWGAGYSLMPHDFGDEFSLKCYLMPWECPKQPDEFSKQELEKRYHHTALMWPPGKVKKKEKNSCHFDVHYFGKDIIHLPPFGEDSCRGSLFYWYGKDWHRVENCPILVGGTICGPVVVMFPSGTRYEIRSGEGEWRLHVEGGK